MVIVSRVVQENKLPCLSLVNNKELVCDACQQGKSTPSSQKLGSPTVSRVPTHTGKMGSLNVKTTILLR
jgi:hypothetical protein